MRTAVLVSGGGTNLQALIDTAARGEMPSVELALVVSNSAGAFALERAKRAGIRAEYLEKSGFEERLEALLREEGIGLIVLAGYLSIVSKPLLDVYEGRIINIHPSLIPRHCGKGMYGHHVHEAVIAAREKESGITIHLVDERYDNGRILFQARCTIEPGDGPEELASKIHTLEQMYFPNVIASFIKSCDSSRHPL